MSNLNLNNDTNSLDSVLKLIIKWRVDGFKIGFTNGCFDLVHPGHVSLLRQARSLCDRLVVGINSDASVKRLKGPGRPIQNEVARSIVLRAFSDVDALVIFDDETPMHLITKLRPDILVKGADYSLAQVVGAEFIQSIGGRVYLARLEEGYSTTKTLSNLMKLNASKL